METIIQYNVTPTFIKKVIHDNFNVLAIDKGKTTPLIYKNKTIVITDVSQNQIVGYTAVPLHQYKGDIKPLTKQLHQREITLGNREKGYAGLVIVIQHKQFVLTHPIIEFNCVANAAAPTDQLNFFPG